MESIKERRWSKIVASYWYAYYNKNLYVSTTVVITQDNM